MLDWIENMMEATGCDWDTAAREYYYATHPEDYEPEGQDFHSVHDGHLNPEESGGVEEKPQLA